MRALCTFTPGPVLWSLSGQMTAQVLEKQTKVLIQVNQKTKAK